MSGPYFEIQAEEPKRAAAFYSQVFGWNIFEVPGLPVPYWRIEGVGTGGGLLPRPAKAPAPQSGTNAFVCSFEVKNFEATQQNILRHSGRIALPKFPIPGRCWQGYFIDPEGNTFGIFEVDTNAGR